MPKLSESPNPVEKYRKQFPDKVNPEEAEPKMTLEIAKLSVGQLGNLMSRYAAWREYTDHLANLATAEHVQAFEEYDYEYSKEYVLLPGDKVTDKKIILTANERLHKLWQNVLEKKIYKDMLSSKVESLNNCISVISREIARRGQTPPDNRHI